MIIAIGEGNIGPTSKHIYIRLVDKKSVECWLTELEVNSVVKSLAKLPDLQTKFSAIHKKGIKIVDDILGHNQGIVFGTGDTTFSDLLELKENKKPECLSKVDQVALQLWNRYTEFGKTLAEFRRKFNESQSVDMAKGRT